jgi:hypothetical protein
VGEKKETCYYKQAPFPALETMEIMLIGKKTTSYKLPYEK